jgi:ribonucleoside-diphosphate reductase alpha chain
MSKAKSGQWWVAQGQRRLANNSVAYTEKPDFEAYLNEMKNLYESKAGERGLFSRVAAQKIAARNGRRDATHEFGTNPCSEIILRSNEFCNLSEVVVRSDDTLETLKEKVRKATIIGTLQSTLTDFRYLRVRWKRNTEEEALLGVSLTGIMDHDVLGGKNGTAESPMLATWLEEMRDVSIKTNKEWAEKLGVNQSVAITCVKPSGTVSQLVDSASGIHPRFSKHYIRRVRSDKKDPLALYMEQAGFPVENDVMSPSSVVFSFPVKAPESSTCVKEVGAMEQLALWKTYQNHWCEHKPSVTVYYTDSEYLQVAQWIWDNFDMCSGISLLPTSDHVYQQAPYEDISAEKYDELVAAMPQNVNWEELSQFEKEDNTTGSQELACVGGACEIV